MEDKNGKRKSNIYSELFNFFSIKSRLSLRADSNYNPKQYGLHVCVEKEKKKQNKKNCCFMHTIYSGKSSC